nr:hypothetical protein [Mycobacterium sp.]
MSMAVGFHQTGLMNMAVGVLGAVVVGVGMFVLDVVVAVLGVRVGVGDAEMAS